MSGSPAFCISGTGRGSQCVEEGGLPQMNWVDLRMRLEATHGIPCAEDMEDGELRERLEKVLVFLAEHHLGLQRTNHLTDRELYRYIVEKVIPHPLEIWDDGIGQITFQDVCPFACEEWYMYYGELYNRHVPEKLQVRNLPPQKALCSSRDEDLEALVEEYRLKPLPYIELMCDEEGDGIH